MKKIIFTKINPNVSDIYLPKQASKNLPKWYKELYSYFGTENKKELDSTFKNSGSIKRCVPVLDALSAGYIISTYCDLWVRKDKEGQIFYAPAIEGSIEFHGTAQAPNHPYMNEHPYPKWSNPWSIKTPKGYSTLFISPVHGGNSFFQIIEGLVDTDKYTNPVNFPFILKDTNFEGLIPAGTPMVQVIPIKRDDWKMQIGNEEDVKNIREDYNTLKSLFFDGYKKLFWSKKVYK